MRGKTSKVAWAAAFLAASGCGAQAGGLARQSQDFDILFLDGTQVQTGVTFVAPQRKLKNIQSPAANVISGMTGGLNPYTGQPFTTSTDESRSYFIPEASVKYDLTGDLACAAQYRQPWGAHTDVGVDTGIALSAIEQKISSTDLGLNCSYRLRAGPGYFRMLGGLSYQHLDGYQSQLLPAGAKGIALPTRIGSLDVSDNSYGWRAGVAYEIPDIALRAQLVYQSEVSYGLQGTISNLYPFPIAVRGDATLPQSVEFKLQSGIAPGWLAFGSVKWTDWSIENAVVFNSARPFSYGAKQNPAGTPITRLNLYYRDGWTVTGGVAHKFNDAFSGASFLTWDRGVSTGLSSLTDTWLIGLTGIYTPTSNVELRLTGILGLLTSGTKNDTIVAGQVNSTGSIASFGNDVVSGLAVSARVKF